MPPSDLGSLSVWEINIPKIRPAFQQSASSVESPISAKLDRERRRAPHGARHQTVDASNLEIPDKPFFWDFSFPITVTRI
jgi:hypothetical protein